MEKLLNHRPPRIAALLALFTVVIYYASPANTVLYIPYKFIGSTTVICGLTIMIWAWLQFKKSETNVCPTAETTSLITGGAYRICRNPMYLGILLILTGIAFFIGVMQALFAPTAFLLIMDKVFIPYEEDKLVKGFGEKYTEYVKSTRRWI